jgi:hypothetical protein
MPCFEESTRLYANDRPRAAEPFASADANSSIMKLIDLDLIILERTIFYHA